jgi:hypothetical protein
MEAHQMNGNKSNNNIIKQATQKSMAARQMNGNHSNNSIIKQAKQI